MSKLNSILIISNKTDVTTDLVVKELLHKDIKFFRLNTEEFPIRINSYIEINNTTELLIKKNNKSINFDEIRSIWYRRPQLCDFNEINLSSEDRQFCLRETNSFLLNLWAVLDNKKWINNPFSTHKLERKAYQLKLATRLKFNIPHTIITNSYDKVKEFMCTKNNKLIVKPISHGGYGIDDEYGIYTTDLEQAYFNIDQKNLEISPFIIQEKVNKKYDIRITVFGSKIFAHKIIVKNNSDIDWRKNNPYDLNYLHIEINSTLQEKIMQFMMNAGLLYGAFDFVVDDSDNWFFIEINTSGQFAWLELATGDKMISELINILSE